MEEGESCGGRQCIMIWRAVEVEEGEGSVEERQEKWKKLHVLSKQLDLLTMDQPFVRTHTVSASTCFCFC